MSYWTATDRRSATASIDAPVLAHFADEQGAEEKRELAVAPEFSVMLEPGELVIPVENGPATSVNVQVSCNLTGAPGGKLHLEAPAGWRVEPAELECGSEATRQTARTTNSKYFPQVCKKAGRRFARCSKQADKKYSEGYSLVTREDLRQLLLLPARRAASEHGGCQSSEGFEGWLHHGRRGRHSSRARATRDWM